MNKRFLMLVLAFSFAVTAFAQKMGEPFLLKAGGKNIDLNPNYAAPAIFDYDRDGKDDLIVGTFKGYFRFYKNVGTKENPVYDNFKPILAGGRRAVAKNW